LIIVSATFLNVSFRQACLTCFLFTIPLANARGSDSVTCAVFLNKFCFFSITENTRMYILGYYFSSFPYSSLQRNPGSKKEINILYYTMTFLCLKSNSIIYILQMHHIFSILRNKPIPTLYKPE
jgi:hypothetical protein